MSTPTARRTVELTPSYCVTAPEERLPPTYGGRPPAPRIAVQRRMHLPSTRSVSEALSALDGVQSPAGHPHAGNGKELKGTMGPAARCRAPPTGNLDFCDEFRIDCKPLAWISGL